MTILFLDSSGQPLDQRTLALVPRMGEGVFLDGVKYFVGVVSHNIDGDRQEVVVTLLQQTEAKKFLGGNT